MTAKRKLLLSYAVLLAWIVLGVVISLRYWVILGVLFIIWGGWAIKRLLAPFPQHRFKFSCYGLAGKIYAYVLGAGLTGLVILSFYYGFFNYDVAYLVDWGMLIMLMACIPLFILAVCEEIKLAADKDKDKSCNSEAE
ncbi:hypothetical protein ES703_91868 [subsurface metagenome]